MRPVTCSAVPSSDGGTLSQHNVLIVGDDHAPHVGIADLLQMYGYAAECVHRSEAASDLIRRQPPDVLILDRHIERPYAGWMLLQQLRADPPTAVIPAVLATSDRAFVRSEREAVRAHRADVLEQPCAPDVLVTMGEAPRGAVYARTSHALVLKDSFRPTLIDDELQAGTA